MTSGSMVPAERLLETFHRAATRMPAYKTILQENGVDVNAIRTMEDFQTLPILDKHKTFQRFDMHELCVDGELPPLKWVLTSSGHSGVFSFGLYDPPGAEAYKRRLDEALNAVFGIYTKKSLLLNCLPMGVKLYSEYCTLGETSVRADMACGLMEKFGKYHEQVIIVAETCFFKHLLELGIERGIDWKTPLVHVILGEEMVAENARRYIEGILNTSPGNLATGLVGSSMGVGELGLNLFAEVPPLEPIIRLRRALHDNVELRREVLGYEVSTVPAIFSYDPDRIYVEFVDGQLVITTLDPTRPVPMVRYTPDDHGQPLEIPESARSTLEAADVDVDTLMQIPLILVEGRGKYVTAGDQQVNPEEVKEGLYMIPELARQTTANFRLASGEKEARLRIQLKPGIKTTAELTEEFGKVVREFVKAPIDITCEPYETFVSGMSLNHEVKCDYLGA